MESIWKAGLGLIALVGTAEVLSEDPASPEASYEMEMVSDCEHPEATGGEQWKTYWDEEQESEGEHYLGDYSPSRYSSEYNSDGGWENEPMDPYEFSPADVVRRYSADTYQNRVPGYAESGLSYPPPREYESYLNPPSDRRALITANPYLGLPISEYDSRMSRYSPEGALNPYTTGGGQIYGRDGTYLGRLSSNPYDPESVANPYGAYGSPYSPNSINNPYSAYGSPYSSESATNPYTTTPPIVVYPRR